MVAHNARIEHAVAADLRAVADKRARHDHGAGADRDLADDRVGADLDRSFELRLGMHGRGRVDRVLPRTRNRMEVQRDLGEREADVGDDDLRGLRLEFFVDDQRAELGRTRRIAVLDVAHEPDAVRSRHAQVGNAHNGQRSIADDAATEQGGKRRHRLRHLEVR